ncbi:MAG: (Fe-S)-binding protein [Actinobacteria bacterium]|nr:(Fe-S)-binding protein [Actinomycetota bacterium]MBU1944129.1 (Fe-S)-binding protein [Actinomycetota bacterium]MBU2687448.1 (Fe-S)-binding protein [Actinomycetota bacterium]
MSNIEHNAFVQKYDLLGCIQCGRCTGGCPVTVRTPLNVRRFVYDTVDDDRLEELSEKPDIWDCTTCNTCAIRCPKGLEPFEVLLGLRAMRAEEGNIEPTARDALESMFNNGNPWGKPAAKRTDWMEGIEGVEKVRILEPGEKADVLIHTCCTACYDPRIIPLAKNLVRVLEAAGVDYGFMGTEEKHCGSEARRLGEEGLFEYFDEENTELLGSFEVNRLVTLSPHCFNSFKNEYTSLDLPVQHYTQLVAELIEDKKLELKNEIGSSVVFHDPCYLGKKNLVFDEPRYILGQIPGVEIAEFFRNKERSLCCEGGGGKMWVESESKEQRLAETRIADAEALGAKIVAVACPFCLLTLEDALKVRGLEEEMRVADILELLGEAL